MGVMTFFKAMVIAKWQRERECKGKQLSIGNSKGGHAPPPFPY